MSVSSSSVATECFRLFFAPEAPEAPTPLALDASGTVSFSVSSAVACLSLLEAPPISSGLDSLRGLLSDDLWRLRFSLLPPFFPAGLCFCQRRNDSGVWDAGTQASRWCDTGRQS